MAGDATVLVTGAGGYIGRHIVTALLDRGARWWPSDRAARVPGGLGVDPRATVLGVDIFDADGASYEALHPPTSSCTSPGRRASTTARPPHVATVRTHHRSLTRLVAEGLVALTVAGTMHEIGYHEGEIDADTPTHPQTLYGVAKNALREALEVDCAAVRSRPVAALLLRLRGRRGQQLDLHQDAQAAERGDLDLPLHHRREQVRPHRGPRAGRPDRGGRFAVAGDGHRRLLLRTPESLAHRAGRSSPSAGSTSGSSTAPSRPPVGVRPPRGRRDVIRRIMAPPAESPGAVAGPARMHVRTSHTAD